MKAGFHNSSVEWRNLIGKAKGKMKNEKGPEIRLIREFSIWVPDRLFPYFFPKYALGISDHIGGRVKRVKKVKCYNQGSGKSRVRSRECGTLRAPPLAGRQVASTWIRESPNSGFGRGMSGKVPSKDAFMSSIRPLTSAPCNLLTL
jgi:hypothetical protein